MKKLLALLFLLFFSASVMAQEVYNSSGKRTSTGKQQKGGFDAQKLIYGGNFGGGLSNNSFAINLTPLVGYRFTENFSAGVGLGFQYFNAKDFFAVLNFNTGQYEYYPLKSTFIYPSLWARYLITDNFFAHVEGEYDIQNFKVYDVEANPSSPNYGQIITRKETYTSPAMLIGGGFRQPISERSSFVVMALYDVVRNEYSPYRGINLRFGINAGF